MNNHESYRIQGRGKALVVNLKKTQQGDRKFADYDRPKLEVCLRRYGYEFVNIDSYVTKQGENLTRKEIELLFSEVAKKEDFKDCDSFVCCVLSHGDYGVFEASDEPVQADTILESFKGHNCSSLAGKPKIFIFQVDNPIRYSAMKPDSDDRRYVIPSEADFLMVWSLIPGDLYETASRCSPFIHSFCERMGQLNGSLEINRMMTRVLGDLNKELEDKAGDSFKKADYRLPVVINMLTKSLYLKKN